MTPTDFCRTGRCERVKATAHGALGALAAICLAYNVSALLLRRERHLAWNAGFYALVTGVEVYQVKRHLDR